MPAITFLAKDGTRHDLDGGDGETLMEIAVNAGLRGITA
ncbi:MAG: ferredoxin, partial [Sphingomonadales bacterium]